MSTWPDQEADKAFLAQLNVVDGLDLVECQMCDGFIFIACEDCCERSIVWSHLEDTGCDDPVPVAG